MLRLVLGALEVKTVSRIARQCGAEWKPVHTAVLDCLLAHRGRNSRHAWPARQVIAEHVHCSERTIDRAIRKLEAWGAIEHQQPRAASQRFGQAQYTFLFSLPQIEEKPCEKSEEISPTVRQNDTPPCDKIEAPIRKEARSSTASPKIKSEPPPRKYGQHDFDERDWRKLNLEIGRLREARAGTADNGVNIFTIACQRAGLSLRRGYELWEQLYGT